MFSPLGQSQLKNHFLVEAFLDLTDQVRSPVQEFPMLCFTFIPGTTLITLHFCVTMKIFPVLQYMNPESKSQIWFST